jgi:hypothetical protein
MATFPQANVVFLPWVRQGAAAAISNVDTLNAGMRGAVDLTAALTINGDNANPLPVTVRLRGPADVIGIDPNEIVRMDPQPGSSHFEPNYFPAIEFDRPDFPWLFTPATANTNGQLRPWLCLVVVRKQEGVILRSGGDVPLPSLEITAPAKPAAELPDLNESWAWAHTQAVADGDLGAALNGRPELSLSRLLCPRILAPHTDYLACVVPTFELGCKAGLGLEIKDTELTSANGLKPAWSLTPAPAVVTLPVYHHWPFRTGEGGDFESLARLLRARPAPAGLGKRPFRIDRPGFRLPDGFPQQALLELEGALQPLQAVVPPAWPAGTEVPFQTELAKIVNTPGVVQALDPSADPVLAPPLYGHWHAARATVARGNTAWFDQLNLDPRHRSVAAFGTRVVQEHQEALMAAAWEQAAELQRANQRLRQLQLSLMVGMSLHTRHFMRLDVQAVLKVSAPALTRLRASAGASTTLAAGFSGKTLPLAAISTPMRRIARERGPITRRVAAQGGARTTALTWIAKLNETTSIGFVTPPPRVDMASFGAVRIRMTQPNLVRQYAEVTDDVLAQISGRPNFAVFPEGQPVTVPPAPFIFLPPERDSATGKDFRAAARAHLARIRPSRPTLETAPTVTLKMSEARDSIISQMEPKRSITLLARAVVATGANASPATFTAPEAALPVETVMAAPKFIQPMYEPLRDLSQQLLLPGLETVLPNSVLGLQTNRRFVQAYLVGLNYEMGRELLWRGYPTDQRGTYFARFWDSLSAAVPTQADVIPLHQWGTRTLGDAQITPSGEQFVMLLRSDLLRRYPTAVIYATKVVFKSNVRMPSVNPADEVHPAFRGSLEPDVSFFGFNLPIKTVVGSAGGGSGDGYFIVIQEQPTEPRFGLDQDTPTSGATHLKVAGGPPAGLPLNGLQWGANAAHMAGITRQQPVRIAIHASKFVMPQ